MMKTAKPRTLSWTPLEGFAFQGALEIVADGKSTTYAVESIPSSWGRAWRLYKHGPGTDKTEKEYKTLIGNDADWCNCKGFARHGHCRHCEALRELIKRGMI
jgi:hypothetical protein